jgi:hypothetical protein
MIIHEHSEDIDHCSCAEYFIGPTTLLAMTPATSLQTGASLSHERAETTSFTHIRFRLSAASSADFMQRQMTDR